MIKFNRFFVAFAFLIFCCDDSSSINEGTSGKSSVEQDSLNSNDNELLECEKLSRGSEKEKSIICDGEPLDTVVWRPDTVCFYNDFPNKDTICCFGESSTWLERDKDGEYVNVSGDYAIDFKYDTLFAVVEPSTIRHCMARIGNVRYGAVQIGSQIWLSENARGEGHCLNDDDENCTLFGTLMSYDKAKEVCSGIYRLPTSADIGILLRSVGASVKIAYTKGVCGEFPEDSNYYDVPLFLSILDSSKNNNAYEFSFYVDGGLLDRNFASENLTYSTEKTCFFLQSDENANFQNALCYDVNEKRVFLTFVKKNAELYVRCIME